MNASMTTMTMTIQERAARALADSRADWAAAMRARAERDEREANDLLTRLMQRRLGLTVTPTGGRVVLDGLTFAATAYTRWEDDQENLHLVRPCPHCGADVHSADIGGWADLGEQLEHFVPLSNYHRNGECARAADLEGDGEASPTPTAVTPAQELLAALTAYIDWACQRHANDE